MRYMCMYCFPDVFKLYLRIFHYNMLPSNAVVAQWLPHNHHNWSGNVIGDRIRWPVYCSVRAPKEQRCLDVSSLNLYTSIYTHISIYTLVGESCSQVQHTYSETQKKKQLRKEHIQLNCFQIVGLCFWIHFYCDHALPFDIADVYLRMVDVLKPDMCTHIHIVCICVLACIYTYTLLHIYIYIYVYACTLI